MLSSLKHNSDDIVAKRKTLFDDRPIEISELTYVIRQDIASLNTQIASLQSYIRAQKQPAAATGKGQVEEHNSNVVMMLQSRLADMGMGFKDVLELRTQVRKPSFELGGGCGDEF
jgi:syntaxin 5